MKIKKYILFSFFYFLTFAVGKTCFSQLTVDVGKDTTYCVGIYPDTMYLAKNITIDGGVEPYTIAWECKVPKDLHSFYTASDFLNDSAVLTPYFVNWQLPGKWIKFTLHLTDSENNYVKDSIRIRFSQFAYLAGYYVFEIEKGDSVLFNQSSVGGGIEPLKFHWQPTIGLTNPNNLVTWCKTDSLTKWRNQYDIVATDSCGCVSVPNLVYEVRVLATGIDDLNKTKNHLNIRKEGEMIYFNNPLKQKVSVAIFSADGTLIHYLNIADDQMKVTNLLKTKGVFIVKIIVGERAGSHKIINL